MQANPPFFQIHVFGCCDLVWELVPVKDGSGEEGVPVNLTGGSLWVEFVSSTGSNISTL